MTTGAAHNRGNSRQDYETPLAVIAAVERRFGKLGIDLAARSDNAKAVRFITPEENSLTVDWADRSCGELAWLNPPFAEITPWARKCHRESLRGCRIAFLVPASVGANWFSHYVFEKALVLFLGNRISFDGVGVFPKDCLIAMYGYRTGFEIWKWKDEA